MERKKRDSYMLGALFALLAIAALIGVYLLVRGSDEQTASATTPTARTTPTQTTRPQTTPTQTAPGRPASDLETPVESAPSETEAAEAPPAETTAPPPAVPLEIIERTAQPEMATINRPMDFTAKVRGEAVSVTMTIRGDTYEYTVALNKIATVGEITTWAASAPGPHATGIYHYFASAVGADGVVVEMPGTSGWSFVAMSPG